MNLLINFFHTPEILYLLHLTFFLLACHFFQPMLLSFVCVLRHSLYWKWKQRIVSIPAILREFFFPFCPIHNALQSVLSVFALKWLNNLLALIEFSLWTLNPLAFWQCCLLFLLFHHCNCSCRGWLVVTSVSFGCSPFSNVGFDPNRVSPGWE